jgi:hypothetical protein
VERDGLVGGGLTSSSGDRPARAEQLVQAAKSAGLTGLVWFDKGGSYLYSPGERAMAKALR